MPHPFFESDRFPFHRPEACQLLDCLVSTCPQVERIVLYYNQSHGSLPVLTTHQMPPDLVWTQALQELANARALSSFCQVMQRSFNQGILVEIIEQIVTAQADPPHIAVPDPVDILVLDRQALRLHLARLALPTSLLKVILITGEAGSGKSHSRYLFEAQADLYQAESLYLGAGMVATLDEVIQQLYSTLGVWRDIPTQSSRHTTDEAWYRAVCIHLLAQAKEQGKKLWIAIDDLGLDTNGVPLMDQQIRGFFNHFVLQMDNPAFRHSFRLMLIDYSPATAPTRWNPNVWRSDQLTVAGITGQHVEDALRQWAKNQQKSIFDQDIKQLADSVMAEAQQQQQQQQIAYIASRVQHYTDTL